MLKNTALIFIMIVNLCSAASGCIERETLDPVSTSGVKKMTTMVRKDQHGHTTEQKNVSKRLMLDNKPGSIKHLYIVSAFSGDVILYSTVKGKVTSSGKRLTPVTVAASDGQYVDNSLNGIAVNIAGHQRRTTEVLQDDGTYGSSIPYLYWWDARGAYHQHYVSGGQFPHISDQPMNWPKIILNLEAVAEKPADLSVVKLKKKTQ